MPLCYRGSVEIFLGGSLNGITDVALKGNMDKCGQALLFTESNTKAFYSRNSYTWWYRYQNSWGFSNGETIDLTNA